MFVVAFARQGLEASVQVTCEPLTNESVQSPALEIAQHTHVTARVSGAARAPGNETPMRKSRAACGARDVRDQIWGCASVCVCGFCC